MTAADIYLSAMRGWKPEPTSEKRSPEKGQKGVVIDFLAAKGRLSSRPLAPMK